MIHHPGTNHDLDAIYVNGSTTSSLHEDM